MSRAARRQNLFVSVFLAVVVLFVFMFRLGVVRGSSMMPTYQNGQTVLVSRRNWLSAPLRHNDVVLVSQGRDIIIKRIYRLPGEEVDDRPPYFVKRRALTSGLSDYYEQSPAIAGSQDPPWLIVPEGYLVILGDNAPGSEDSRMFGPVPIKDVLGVVVGSPPPPYTNQEIGKRE